MDSITIRHIIFGILSVFLLLLTYWYLSLNSKFTLDDLQELDQVDRIVLTARRDGKTNQIKVVTDPKRIASIINVVRTYADNWQRYGFGAGTPPAPLVVDFYYKGELQTGFGIGYTTHNEVIPTPFYLKKLFGPGRTLQEHEFQKLIETLDVDESLTYAD